MKSMFVGFVLGPSCCYDLAFQYSAASRVARVSRARCVEIPCADGIDEMIETATIIREQVRESGIRGCHTLSRQVSSYASKFRQRPRAAYRAKFARKPTTMCRTLARRS